MGTIVIDGFSTGMDRTRESFATPAGSLWDARNLHLTRGGDLEKRKAFVQIGTLPVGCTGLRADSQGLLTFGRLGPSAILPTLPSSVRYISIPHPTDPAAEVAWIPGYALFRGLPYVVAYYSNQTYHNFYGYDAPTFGQLFGVRVGDWGLSPSTEHPNSTGAWRATVIGRKVYGSFASTVFHSGVDAPLDWRYGGSNPDPGAGFFVVNTDASSDAITALGKYKSSLAAFTAEAVQVWNVFSDESNNEPIQTIMGPGTVAPNSVLGFADIDLFYLSRSGIRSIRERANVNTPGVSDVGSPIDEFVQAHLAAGAQATDAQSLIDPDSGRFWMIIGSRIFVFNYFPGKKVSGWTYYDTPGITWRAACTHAGRIYMLDSQNRLYIYGGLSGNVYDNSECSVALPFMGSKNKDGQYLDFRGIDIAARGAWDVTLFVDPRDFGKGARYGVLDGWTLLDSDYMGEVRTPVVQPVLTCNSSTYASLSQILIHYLSAERQR